MKRRLAAIEESKRALREDIADLKNRLNERSMKLRSIGQTLAQLSDPSVYKPEDQDLIDRFRKIQDTYRSLQEQDAEALNKTETSLREITVKNNEDLRYYQTLREQVKRVTEIEDLLSQPQRIQEPGRFERLLSLYQQEQEASEREALEQQGQRQRRPSPSRSPVR